ncbi:hypothetical protein PROFUN_03709 [Planoprotostelium fungivorum]|uniref:Uncharacterized protein n=1 Tax=Planoprotostelium fungivorum TaxID=1890364 RepID=A0A2P6NDI8_9EUKA|nr:hypothetical protein PROFUN_03709 [Planoprotostelium fungivorum]
MEESITDSNQHALGECIFTRELNNQLWATLKHNKGLNINSIILATFNYLAEN